MNMQRWILRSLPVATAFGAASASLAGAQSLLIGQPRVMNAQQSGTELFEWTGQVDREVQVVMRGNNLWTNNIGQTERPRARSRSFSRLPNQDGEVTVRILDGRGNVDVVQQPSRSNNYTTIVRVIDPRAGSANYRLAAYWQGYSNGDVYGNNGNGRGRGRGRDVYRDRDRDGRDDRNGGYNNGGYNNGGNNNNREVMHWSGNVDGELEIRVQNGRVSYRNLSGQQPTGISANPGSMDMRNTSNLSIVQNQGRGSVTVIQQPSQFNGYATVLRVRDPQGGYGYYDFSLIRPQ